MKRQVAHWILCGLILLWASQGLCESPFNRSIQILLERGLVNAAKKAVEALPPSREKTLLEARISIEKGEIAKGCRLLEGIEPSGDDGDRILFLQLRCRKELGVPGAWRKSLELFKRYPQSTFVPLAFEEAFPPPGMVPSKTLIAILKKRTSPKATLLKAEALASQGASQKALHLFDRVKAKDNSTLKRVLWDKASIFEGLGKHKEAAGVLNRLCSMLADLCEKRICLAAEAVVLFRKGDASKALKKATSLMDAPGSPDKELADGFSAFVISRRWRAETLLSKALRSGELPREAETSVTHTLARLLVEDGRLFSAVSLLRGEESLLNADHQKNLDRSEALFLAKLLLKIDMPEQAREILRGILKERPWIEAESMLLKAGGANGERERALAFLVEHGSPQWRLKAFKGLCELLFEKERYQDLLDLLNAYLQRYPQEFPPEEMLLAAKAHLFMGDKGMARDLLHSLVSAGVAGSGEVLARLLMEEGNSTGAWKVLEESGEATKAPLLAAQFLWLNGKKRAARKLIKKWKRMDPCKAYLVEEQWSLEEGEGRNAIKLAAKAEKACKGGLKEWATFQRLMGEASLGKVDAALSKVGDGTLCGALVRGRLGGLLTESQLPILMESYRPLVEGDPAKWFGGEKELLSAKKLEEDGKRGKAIKTLKLAISKLRGSRFEPAMRRELAAMLSKNLRYREALRVMRDPLPCVGDETFELERAKVFLGGGKVSTGVSLLQRGVEGRDWSPEAKCEGNLLLGGALEEMGDVKNALQSYLQVVKGGCLDRADSSTLIHMGLVLERGDYDEAAAEVFKKAMTRKDAKTKVEATFWLGDLFEKKGEYQKALANYLAVGYGLSPIFPWRITARYRAAVILSKDQDGRKDALAILADIAKNHKDDRWGEAALRKMRRIKADENTGSAP